MVDGTADPVVHMRTMLPPPISLSPSLSHQIPCNAMQSFQAGPLVHVPGFQASPYASETPVAGPSQLQTCQ